MQHSKTEKPCNKPKSTPFKSVLLVTIMNLCPQTKKIIKKWKKTDRDIYDIQVQ